MNKLEQTLDAQLRTIGASCPHLLHALHHSPEAVLGEIQVLESACRAFEEAYRTLPAKSGTAVQMQKLVAALRCQMAQQGLRDDKEFAAFRQDISAIQNCANALRDSLGLKQYCAEITVK